MPLRTNAQVAEQESRACTAELRFFPFGVGWPRDHGQTSKQPAGFTAFHVSHLSAAGQWLREKISTCTVTRLCMVTHPFDNALVHRTDEKDRNEITSQAMQSEIP
jgi:hypothetical protein